LVWSVETAKLAREHNNANVISIGGRLHEEAFCLQLVDIFLATPFSGDERHKRRINQISNYEDKGSI
jgi:ribose 5-phosphate isomerase B